MLWFLYPTRGMGEAYSEVLHRKNPEATSGRFYQNFCLLRTVTIPCSIHVQIRITKKASAANEEKKYEITSQHLLTIKAHRNTCLKLVNFIFIVDYVTQEHVV